MALSVSVKTKKMSRNEGGDSFHTKKLSAVESCGMKDIVFKRLDEEQMVGCRGRRMGSQNVQESRVSKMTGNIMFDFCVCVCVK